MMKTITQGCLILFFLDYAVSSAIKGPSLSDDSEFTNRTLQTIFQTKCENSFLTSLIEKKIFQEQHFTGCKGDLASEDLFNRLCVSAIYNLNTICNQNSNSVDAEEPKSVDSDDDLCRELSSTAVEPTDVEKPDKAYNVSLEIASQFKNEHKAADLCQVCKKSEARRNVCKSLLNTFRILGISNKADTVKAEQQNPPEHDTPILKQEPVEDKAEGQDKPIDKETNVDVEQTADGRNVGGNLTLPVSTDGNVSVTTRPSTKDSQSMTTLSHLKTAKLPTKSAPGNLTLPVPTDGNVSGTTHSSVKDSHSKTTQSQLKAAKLPTKPAPDLDNSLTEPKSDSDFVEDDLSKIDDVEVPEESQKKPEDTELLLEDHMSHNSSMEDTNYYLSYLLLISVVAIAMYLIFHNKQKILALILEGRRGRSAARGRRGRSSSAQYRKLDNNLEEAMGPSSHDSQRHVIY